MLDSIFYRISKSEIIVIAIGLLSLLGQVLFFRTLDLPILQSDPYLYLLQSRQWWVEDLHLPGYAFILWLVNKLSFACLPDALLLHLVAATTWLVSILTFIKITKILEIEEKIRVFLLLIYAFFPLIGLTFAAWPLSDSSVCLLVNLLVIACLKKNWGLLTVALAFGLVLHKITWGFCSLIAIYAVIALGFPCGYVIISILPLVLFWAWIVFNGEGPLWLIEHDIERHFPSYSALPVFDGIIGTILSGGLYNIVKGIALLIIYIFELILLFKALINKQWLAIALLLPLLILGMIVNQWLAIAVLRFGKVAILAVAILIASKDIKIPKYCSSSIVLLILMFFLISSQFCYAVYMKFYFREGGVLDEKIKLENSVMERKGLPIYERGTGAN